jgi:hypothetical protein
MTRARKPVMHGHIGSGKASRPADRFADLAVGTDQAFVFLAVPSCYGQAITATARDAQPAFKLILRTIAHDLQADD